MKRSIWFLLAFLAFLPLVAKTAVYRAEPVVIAPQTAPTLQTPPVGRISPAIAVLEQGHELSMKYGSRPPYAGPVFAPKQPLDKADTQNVIPYLIACESRDHSVKIVDSNGFYSYGILQMQSSTVALFNSLENTDYDPMNPVQAEQLAEIAIEHGYLYRWSCAMLEHLI